MEERLWAAYYIVPIGRRLTVGTRGVKVEATVPADSDPAFGLALRPKFICFVHDAHFPPLKLFSSATTGLAIPFDFGNCHSFVCSEILSGYAERLAKGES